ncbi:hypothetical protein [Nocardia sp. NPDC051832]|uniref:hypothetical protein n=1 Tax=Nocardia sp. NPDC051832 TaxID=3155673 RepID=UPI00343DA30D
MTRGVRKSVYLGAFSCLLSGLLAGCSNNGSDTLKDLATCGEFVFPDDAKMIWYREHSTFGDELLDAVVEIAASKVAEFKQQSRLEKFEPGVPRYWRESWQDIGQAQLLASDAGNEHLVELNQSPTRWVVIHDSGSEVRQLFIKVGC